MIAQTFRRIQQVTFKSKRLAARPLMTEERNSYIAATTGKLIRSYEHSRHYNFYTHIFLYYLLSRGDTSPPPLSCSPLPFLLMVVRVYTNTQAWLSTVVGASNLQHRWTAAPPPAAPAAPTEPAQEF